MNRLLYTRREAAHQPSISVRQLDRFIAQIAINTRRMGSRVLILHGELMRVSRADHLRHRRMTRSPLALIGWWACFRLQRFRVSKMNGSFARGGKIPLRYL